MLTDRRRKRERAEAKHCGLIDGLVGRVPYTSADREHVQVGYLEGLKLADQIIDNICRKAARREQA